mmetsp:Transcript_58926/g.184779  ORF Transcript_58926/g.184779 Transcript_58926/m.184779 type:complete len:330 (-) Transcript_58926:607-1596(-)
MQSGVMAERTALSSPSWTTICARGCGSTSSEHWPRRVPASPTCTSRKTTSSGYPRPAARWSPRTSSILASTTKASGQVSLGVPAERSQQRLTSSAASAASGSTRSIAGLWASTALRPTSCRPGTARCGCSCARRWPPRGGGPWWSAPRTTGPFDSKSMASTSVPSDSTQACRWRCHPQRPEPFGGWRDRSPCCSAMWTCRRSLPTGTSCSDRSCRPPSTSASSLRRRCSGERCPPARPHTKATTSSPTCLSYWRCMKARRWSVHSPAFSGMTMSCTHTGMPTSMSTRRRPKPRIRTPSSVCRLSGRTSCSGRWRCTSRRRRPLRWGPPP